MRIAQITSTYISVPPKSHGGTELMVYHLVEELLRRGHQVELFASGDSVVSCPLHAVVPVATLYDDSITTYIDKEMETRNTHNLYAQADRFDVIHSHWPTLAPYFSPFTTTPTVVTYAYIEPALHRYYQQNFQNVFPVCVSQTQADLLGDATLPVIYNGIPVRHVPFVSEPDDFLLIVARIVPNKGIAEAIQIAQRTGHRLVIVGDVSPYIPWSRRYYEEQVRPFIDGERVVYIEQLPNAEVHRLMGRAKAFLFPLQWDEPFGLVVVEAMAAGAPVVTLRRGSMTELVCDGETGFLADDIDGMVAALGRIDTIDRAACRRWVESRFTVEEMVGKYERLYNKILAK